jgi:dimethylamine monooxygenase subunit A
MMLPYFPLRDDVYRMAMDVQALAVDCLIEIDEHYQAELALKQRILADDYAYYFQALPHSELAQWEALALLLPNMARHYPQHFALGRDGKQWEWRNHLLGTTTRFVYGAAESLPLPPLDWLGRQVQEDLLLMDGQAAGTPLMAGQLCFGSHWCLDDKIGRSFLDIHAPVPRFNERVGRSADLMMQRLKAERPVGRVNWSLVGHNLLNAAPRFARELAAQRAQIGPHNVGERVFLRLERQTLSRLPQTQAVLFTIHTYQVPLALVLADQQRARRLRAVVESMPSEMLDYKSMNSYLDTLRDYLDAHAPTAD